MKINFSDSRPPVPISESSPSNAKSARRAKQVEMLRKMRAAKPLEESSPISEGFSPSKAARLQRDLEIDLRRIQFEQRSDPKKVRDIVLAMEAIEALKSDRGLFDGKVSGMLGNKYPRLLRAKELAIRSELMKGDPDVHKVADMFMTAKTLRRASTDASVSDTRATGNKKVVVKEMTAAGAGAGAPDATSQGPLVWGDKGPGVMKTSPHGKVEGKSDGTKKSKTKVDIDSKKLNESEFSDDLNAMYGGKLEMSEEDAEAKKLASEYLEAELRRSREKGQDSRRRTSFIVDSLRGDKILESSRPRKITINEAKKSRVNAAGNYTKPTMRKKLFKKIMAGTKGGDPGEWSARKAQLLAREYKKAGGGYKN